MKKRNIIIIAIIFMAVGFATVTTNLIINGMASIGKNTEDFDVYFSKAIENGIEKNVLIKDKTHIEYTANLMNKNDTYILKYEVTNASQNYNLNITLDITEENEYLSITNEFLDEPLLARTSREGTLTIKLKKPTIEAISYQVKIEMTAEIAERNSLGTGDVPPVVENPIKVLSGDGTHVGDEIAIGTEHFYVIENDGENIQMLAKYNLEVGNIFDSSYEWNDPNGLTPIENPSGIQKSDMLGLYYVGMDELGNSITGDYSKGVLAFSETSYWDTEEQTYPAYVYNENSNLYKHVESYITYINDNYNVDATGELISLEQLTKLGCDDEWVSCYSAPEWVYATSYWGGTVDSHYNLINIGSVGSYLDINPFSDIYLGVRPVITISSSLI